MSLWPEAYRLPKKRYEHHRPPFWVSHIRLIRWIDKQPPRLLIEVK
jgi:hypothetical protein